MPSKAPLTALRDMVHHIELAEHFVAGFDDKAFLADARTVYAVTRCLEVISEASRRLPAGLKARHPSPWKNIAGAGNIYRHDYEDVAAHLGHPSSASCRRCELSFRARSRNCPNPKQASGDRLHRGRPEQVRQGFG
jgi:uncharacterized protein with HEPN domain